MYGNKVFSKVHNNHAEYNANYSQITTNKALSKENPTIQA